MEMAKFDRKVEYKSVALLSLAGVLLRILAGYFPYSGENTPPRFGDYEAQRHWKEITVNQPISSWYEAPREGAWWPLDYPPLTAYHELMLGKISEWYEPASVANSTSYGYESDTHRSFMRLSVVASDLLSYFPAVYFFVSTYSPMQLRDIRWAVGPLLLNPALIFVDHCHFQYNSVALALLLFAVGLLNLNRPYCSAVVYTMSFMFKQTLLYFAPMFFAFMLGQAVKLTTWRQTVQRLGFLGICVISTVLVLLFPVIQDCESLNCSMVRSVSVIERVFPFGRGVFEDYVPNIWVVLHPVLRIRGLPLEGLKRIGAASTILTLCGSFIPGVLLGRKPDKEWLPVGLAASGLAFYLFGWLVHEKAIILPFTMLIASSPLAETVSGVRLIRRVCEAAFMSLLPLMKVEGNVIVGLGLFSMNQIVSGYKGDETQLTPDTQSISVLVNRLQRISNFVAAMGASTVLLEIHPNRYPFLADLIIVIGCFTTFISTWSVLIWSLWTRKFKLE
jgi:alpha-1,3-glucosyltransferase